MYWFVLASHVSVNVLHSGILQIRIKW
jgi:hypothetical protein